MPHSLLPSGSRTYARLMVPIADSRGPGRSSTEVPPFAMAVAWNSSTCSGESQENATVLPLATVAGSSLIGSVTMKFVPPSLR